MIKYIRQLFIKQNSQKGVATLMLVVLVGGVVLDMVLSISLITFFLLKSGFNAKNSYEALITAQSGADDAIIKVLRDNTYGSGIGATSTIVFDSAHLATVVVCKDAKYDKINLSCSISNIGQTQILSTGSASNTKKIIEIIIASSNISGEVFVKSYKEIPF